MTEKLGYNKLAKTKSNIDVVERTITVYITPDGKEFIKLKEAEEWVIKEALLTCLLNECGSIIRDYEPEDIVDVLMKKFSITLTEKK